MSKVKQKISNIFNRIALAWSIPYYGFYRGHDHIESAEVEDIKSLVGASSGLVNKEFEDAFSNFFGLKSVSFAAGRMGFYALLRVLDVKPNDEVILTGSTCAVMANAVLRVGAKPIYADISKDTLGTSAKSVEKCISLNTKLIVAQHSFGIPCEISEICRISKKYNIFLLEDCALAFDSKIDGVKLGLFGDASLFSFDHTKPINAMIGGLICTEDRNLYRKLKEVQKKSGELSILKQKALFNRFLLERKYCNPKKYGLFQIIDFVQILSGKLFNKEDPFLTKDSGSEIIDNYPYPSKMPEFISLLALNELKRWPNSKQEKEIILKKYISILNTYGYDSEITSIYCKNGVEIIPLRFVFCHDNGVKLRNRMNDFIQVDWTWFKAPIISTTESINNYKYVDGSCPVSELINKTIVNLPTSIKGNELDDIIERLSILK
jgi:perosamine synthetase